MSTTAPAVHIFIHKGVAVSFFKVQEKTPDVVHTENTMNEPSLKKFTLKDSRSALFKRT